MSIRRPDSGDRQLNAARECKRRVAALLADLHFPLSTTARFFLRLVVCAALPAVVAPGQTAAEWTIETVAGTGDIGDSGPAAEAQLRLPYGVATDGGGNLYIADFFNHRVRKIDAAGTITTIAGTGGDELFGGGFGGDGGPAAEARLNGPSGVAVDGAGNLYIADFFNHRIRKVDAAGTITTVAGTGGDGLFGGGFGGDGGPAAEARLNGPSSVAADGAGNLYIADFFNHRVRKVDAAGTITTIAGTGGDGLFGGGFGGDGGSAAEAQLNGPSGMAVDGAGSLYIADAGNHRVRRVDAAGTITTVAGTGADGYSGDNGSAAEAQLNIPIGVALDAAGDLYIADAGNHRIRKIDAARTITTVAGTGADGYGGDGRPAVEARLDSPRGVAVDGAGNLYIADAANHRIRKIDAAGLIATVAGGELGDGRPATAASLFSPSGVAVDGAGNFYIADAGNHRIRKVDAAGTITTIAGTGEGGYSGDDGPATAARLDSARGVALDGDGNLYIADTENHRIRKVDAAGTIVTVAGTGAGGYSGDGGPAIAAQLNGPSGVAPDAAGNLYIADFFNHRIRRIDAAGTIVTVAGTGAGGYSGDGGPAIAAQLNGPSGVAPDAAGNLYIADIENHRIRRIDAAGTIATVAGAGEYGDGGDGGPAAAAQLALPEGVAVDSAGNFYIADTRNHRIRRVDAAGVITTVAGTGEYGDGGDGGPATEARIASPLGVAVDSAGNFYIADSGNHRIRKAERPREPAAHPRISSGGVVLSTGAPVVSRISPNAIVSVYGQEFAPEGTREANPALDSEGRIAANLAATCLEIDGKRAPLFAVFANQINAQAPHDLTPGPAPVEVIRGCGAQDEQRSPAAPAAVAAVSPAFFNFTIDTGGRNPIVALHGDGTELAGAPGLIPGVELTPAEPGEIVALFGTGFGATEPPLEAGEIPAGAVPNALPLLVSEVAFAFAGMLADVFYAGVAPCCAGLYQFVVRVPPALPDGDAPVVATVQGVSTPAGPFLTIRRQQ